MKQDTSLVKNSSQTVEIKDKTNEKKPYLEQNISNHKLDGSDKKANTNTVVLLDMFRMKQTKMYVCTLEEFILVEIWIHYCTKLNDEVN